ncbi:hypothetical protein LTR09_012342 [Extremus antarcticus]|uniref:Uncharacterized protein n=1 Tax=Extremus antarcticus TaxID=702011 RepID=A0AAJ0G6V7_9PEZI|nr:hypothetical protein LTR09_012342 [Extremus antarcticus]
MGFGVVQSVLVLVACGFGLGQSGQVVLPRALATAQNLYFASNIILIFTLALVKISAALWVAGILVSRSVRQIKGVNKGVFCALLAASALWTVASFFALLLPSVLEDRCMGTV